MGTSKNILLNSLASAIPGVFQPVSALSLLSLILILNLLVLGLSILS
jgi:hypothetical protein